MRTPANVTKSEALPEPSPVLRWEFTRGSERVRCQVDHDPGTGAFAVAVVMCRDLRFASVGTFHAVGAALRQHAKLAAELRASGWTLAAYTN
jgi:hypothetical protein